MNESACLIWVMVCNVWGNFSMIWKDPDFFVYIPMFLACRLSKTTKQAHKWNFVYLHDTSITMIFSSSTSVPFKQCSPIESTVLIECSLLQAFNPCSFLSQANLLPDKSFINRVPQLIPSFQSGHDGSVASQNLSQCLKSPYVAHWSNLRNGGCVE